MANEEVFVDSDILIWHLKAMTQIVGEVNALTSKSLLYTSPIVVAEIFAGARKKEEDIIRNMFSSIYVVKVNAEIGETAGKFLNNFSKSHDLKIADAIIAASSTYSKMKLWTLNKKHYPMLSKKDFYEFDLMK